MRALIADIEIFPQVEFGVMGFDLPLFHSPSWPQGAGNCGLLKIPETLGGIERLGCSPKWNHPLPLQPNF